MDTGPYGRIHTGRCVFGWGARLPVAPGVWVLVNALHGAGAMALGKRARARWPVAGRRRSASVGRSGPKGARHDVADPLAPQAELSGGPSRSLPSRSRGERPLRGPWRLPRARRRPGRPEPDGEPASQTRLPRKRNSRVVPHGSLPAQGGPPVARARGSGGQGSSGCLPRSALSRRVHGTATPAREAARSGPLRRRPCSPPIGGFDRFAGLRTRRPGVRCARGLRRLDVRCARAASPGCPLRAG